MLFKTEKEINERTRMNKIDKARILEVLDTAKLMPWFWRFSWFLCDPSTILPVLWARHRIVLPRYPTHRKDVPPLWEYELLTAISLSLGPLQLWAQVILNDNTKPGMTGTILHPTQNPPVVLTDSGRSLSDDFQLLLSNLLPPPVLFFHKNCSF